MRTKFNFIKLFIIISKVFLCCILIRDDSSIIWICFITTTVSSPEFKGILAVKDWFI